MNAGHRPVRIAVLALALSAALAAGALAESKSISETRPAPADGTVKIECLAGTVTVEGWDKKEVSVEGTLPEEVDFQFDQKGGTTRIEAQWPDSDSFMETKSPGSHHFFGNHREIEGDAKLTIRVPKGSEVDVQTVSAEISASGLRERVSLESVSGDVTVSDAPGRVEAQSVSGAVVVDGKTSRLTAASVSGDVEVRGDCPDAELSSVSGTVKIEGARIGRLEASSVSGDVEFRGGLDPDGRYEVSSHSGRVEFWLPAAASADFEVSTFSGDIESDFGGQAERTSHYTPGKELDFSVGKGEARVELSSFSGKVLIRKM